MGKPTKKIQTEKKLESNRVKSTHGNHNIALSNVAAEAKAVKNQPSKVVKTAKPFNYSKAAKESLLLLAIAGSIAFYSVMHSYHDALKKQEQLTMLFNNPNARVAAGSKGKDVLKKLKSAKKPVKKVSKVEKTEETLTKILNLLEEQNKAKAAEKAQQIVEPPAYQAPLLETAAPVANSNQISYTLYDQATIYPTVTRPDLYIAPQPQPLLVPVQPAPVVVEQPKPKVEKDNSSATLEQIISMLKKTQAAQVDLESQKN